MKTKLLEVEVKPNVFTLATLDGRVVAKDMSRRFIDVSVDHHNLLNKEFPNGWEVTRYYLKDDEKRLAEADDKVKELVAKLRRG